MISSKTFRLLLLFNLFSVWASANVLTDLADGAIEIASFRFVNDPDDKSVLTLARFAITVNPGNPGLLKLNKIYEGKENPQLIDSKFDNDTYVKFCVDVCKTTKSKVHQVMISKIIQIIEPDNVYAKTRLAEALLNFELTDLNKLLKELNWKKRIPIPDDAVFFQGHHYKVYSDNSLTWPEAQKKCTDIGGYLAIIKTPGENKFVGEQLLRGYYGAWFGARTKDTVNRRWMWVDGQLIAFYQNWAVGYKPPVSKTYGVGWIAGGKFSAFGDIDTNKSKIGNWYEASIDYRFSGFTSRSRNWICEWDY